MRRGLPGDQGPLSASLCVRLSAPGQPHVEEVFTLCAGEKRVDVAGHLLKDPTPLQEAHLAFPFHLPEGRFRYEGPLAVLDPGADLLPGAYADRLTAQNWVAVGDGKLAVLWSSREAPVVSLAKLWPGRLSPAHSAVVRRDVEHPRQEAAELRGGAIYSLFTANNTGTNFAVSQSGSPLFRYSITPRAGCVSDSQAVMVGQQSLTPLQTMFTEHLGPRPLPPVGSFLSIDHPSVQLLAMKRAEDGNGVILRLWTTGSTAAQVRLSLPELNVTEARLCCLAEEDIGEAVPTGRDDLCVRIPARGVRTVRVIGEVKRR